MASAFDIGVGSLTALVKVHSTKSIYMSLLVSKSIYGRLGTVPMRARCNQFRLGTFSQSTREVWTESSMHAWGLDCTQA